MLETASKLFHYWRRYPSSKCYEINEKFRIWRFAVAPSDAAEKNGNMGAQPVPHVYNSPKLFWKIYYLYDFWCAQTCSFRAVLRLHARNLTVAVSAICGNFLYRCTSTFLAINYCGGIYFLQVSQLSIRSGVHNLFIRFLDFSQFLTAISRKLDWTRERSGLVTSYRQHAR